MYCDKLFEYERRYREKGFSPEQREKQPLKDEKPVIEAFLSWLDATVNRADYIMKHYENFRDTALMNNLILIGSSAIVRFNPFSMIIYIV